MGGWVKAEFRFSPVKTRLNAMVVPHPERQFPLDPEGRTGFISPFVKFSRDPLARFPLASKRCATWNSSGEKPFPEPSPSSSMRKGFSPRPPVPRFTASEKIPC